MTHRDPAEERRWQIAHAMNELPASCWADLATWAAFGFTLAENDFGDMEPNYFPSSSGGGTCALEATAHPHGCCYCGKFRAGLEVTDGRS